MSIQGIVTIAVAVASLLVSIVALVNVVALRRMLQGRAERPAAPPPPSAGAGAVASGNVFCRSCGAMYDSTQAACPMCHTPRG